MKGQPARRENGARAILSIWRAVCILALAGTLWFIFRWAFLCARAFSRRAARWLLWLWGAGALCAAADEGIQLFAPGRAARVSDILLDSCGMLVGLGLALAAAWAWGRGAARRK